MSVKVNGSQGAYDAAAAAATTAKAKEAEVKQEAATIDTKDTYEKSTPEKSVTYKPDMDKVKALKVGFENQVHAFNKMVEALFKRQAGASQGATFDLLEAMQGGNLKARLEELSIDETARAEAEKMIGEDGEWGVDKTAARILDFAKAISGGDPSKIDLLRNAVEKGFDEAARLWGGDLPEISQKTYDKVMEGFDAWKNGETAEAETEAE